MSKKKNSNLSLFTLLAATFMGILDTSIVNVASPQIQKHLPASFEQVQLVLTGYIVAYGVALIIGGRLGDNYGRKRIFLIGLLSFVALSFGCAIAPSASFLIIMRILQGVAGSLMLPQVLSIIRVLFDGPKRARALGLYGATIGVASIMGQILGGILISLNLFGWGWRWIFLVNLPIGLIAALIATLTVTESVSDQPAKPDSLGGLLLAVTIGTFIYPVVSVAHHKWTWLLSLLIIISVLCGALFIKWERRLERHKDIPLAPVSLFKIPAFRTGLSIALTYYGGNLGLYLILAYLIQQGFHYSAIVSALIYAPLGIGFMVSSLASRRLVSKYGINAMISGSVLTIISFILIGLELHTSLPKPLLIIPLFIIGLGQGLIAVTLIGKVLEGIESNLAGLASGSMLTTTQIANSFSIALCGGIFSVILKHGSNYTNAFIGCLVWLSALAVATILLLRHLKQIEYLNEKRSKSSKLGLSSNPQ